MALLIAALTLAPSTAGAAGLKIERPGNDRFIAKAPVRVELRAPKGTKSVAVTVEGRAVGKAFKQVRPGLWRGRLGGKQVRPGVNHLVAVSHGGSGARDYASSRFVLGKSRSGLLTLGAPGMDASGFSAPLRIGNAPWRLSASLNGKRLRWPSGLWPDRKAVLRLGADDGLRFGPNRLRVFAARRDGDFNVERSTVVVPRSRPLVGAGRDRRGASGSTLRLDGSSTRAARPGASLSYRWKLVRAPRGSKRKLSAAATPRPRLRTDRAGTYAVRLTVTETIPGGKPRRAADTATVYSVANVPPLGLPIETIVPNGKSGAEADTAIRVGATTYPLGAPKGNRIQALIFDRTTLALKYSASYKGTETEAETLAAKIKAQPSKPLVVISAPALGSIVGTLFAQIVEEVGGPARSQLAFRTGWSVVGVQGSKGGAYFAAGYNIAGAGAGPRGALDGYLQETIVNPKELGAKGFAFVPAERVSFDTAAPGAPALRNKIVVGADEYLSAPLAACGTGGFQVAVLLAETLAPVLNHTFTTNGCGNSADTFEQITMTSVLASMLAGGSGPDEGPKLAIVQSVGSPYDPTAAASWSDLAAMLERLGGTASVFAPARGSYALVGGVGIKRLPLSEASQTLTGTAARIAGLLVPDRRGAYVPMLASPAGQTPYDLAEIAYRPSVPWPYSQTPGEQAALAYIATEVLDLPAPSFGSSCYVPPRPDVRSEYCTLDLASSWSGYVTQVRGAPFVAGKGFSKEDWEHVTNTLAGPGYNEFNAVSSTWGLVSTLQVAFGEGEKGGQVDLSGIATEVEKAIAPPAAGEAAGWWLELLANFASIASYFDFGVSDEVVQKITGSLSGSLFIAGQSLYDREGNPLAEEFKLEADDVAGDLSERFQRASAGLGKVGELIVTDSGKLQAAHQDPALGINSEGVEELVALLGLGGRQWSYEALMPVAYEAANLQPGEQLNNPLPTNATKYECEFFEAGGGSGGYFPYKKAPAAAQLYSTEPGPTLGVMVLRGSEAPSDGNPEVHPRSPTQSLVEPMFKKPEEKVAAGKPEQKSGVGLFAPWFWRSAFGYPGAKTQQVFCR